MCFVNSEYAFAAKRARVETPPPPSRPVTDHPTVTEPPKAVETVAVAKKKKTTKTTVVKRIRRVLRPKPAVVKKPKERRSRRFERLDPVTMKVVELRAELRRRGWKASGLKAVLVDRLLAAIAEDDESDEEDEDEEESEDAVLELEEVDEEYDEEVEVEMAMDEAPETEGRDEIVRESLDLLSQRSTLDESERPTLAEDASASKKRPQGGVFPPLDERGETTETTQTADDTRDEEDAHSTSTTDAVGFAAAPVATTRAASEPLAPDVRVMKSASKWAFLAGALRHNVSSPKSRALDDGAARPTDAPDVAIDASSSNAVVDSPQATATMGVDDRTSRTTDDESARPVERKASLKVSFVAKKAETAITVSDAQAAVPEPGQLLPEDPVSRLRSISLPQASVSAASAEDPVTPNGQRTTDELAVARSEPAPGALNETDEQRQHQLTIEQEAQRLRIAAKLSAKKRFEEAMLSSSFWAKRDRLKTSQQPQVESVAPQPRDAVGAKESTPSVTTLSIKLEPESEASTTEPRFMEAVSPSRDASAVLLKPELAACSQSVKVPFASSSRRFSDPSRRVSALRRRESVSSRRDSTSSRRDSVSSRRNSLTRRRDSGASTLSSGDSDKTAATTAKAAGPRKPLNLVSGLHSFTSLLEKENATVSGASAAGSARSAPVVNALKQAEKSRLLEQKKTLEKLKRKEALMKKYEEQRKLDDDKKKKAVSVKEKAERDAKLKREQDKLNEKKQRELELAKRRHQKLQEMRAGLEKKRAMMAAEKQAGATAKLAAASSSSSSVTSSSTLSSGSSKAVVRPAPASQTQKPFVAASTSQAPPTKPAMVTVHAAGVVAKPVKPSAPVPALKAIVATHAAKPVAPPPAKHRPTDTSTYDMSDNAESSDSDDDDADSDDESKANKKNIPRWARKENLERILRVQFGPNASDPSPAIFPDFVDTCDLEAIFEPTDVRKKKRFQKRSSSGNWFGDRPTAREKAVYKRDMGYLR